MKREAPERRRTHTWSSVPRHRKSCAFRVVTRKIQAKIFFGKRASVPARHTHTSPAHALDTVTRYTCPPSPFPPPPFVRSAPPSGTSATVFGRSIIHPSCRTRSASHDRNIRSDADGRVPPLSLARFASLLASSDSRLPPALLCAASPRASASAPSSSRPSLRRALLPARSASPPSPAAPPPPGGPTRRTTPSSNDASSKRRS